MNSMTRRVISALLALLSCGVVLAQASTTRPPDGATQEEKRAFYQQRAAEREKATVIATPPSATVSRAGKPPAAMDHSAHMAAGVIPAAASTALATAGTAPATPASVTQAGEAARTRMSGKPPGMADMAGMPGMGGMGMMGMGARSGPPTKRMWLRAGSDPVKSGFAREEADAPAQAWLVTPQGSPAGEALPAAEEGQKYLSFPMPVQGYYRLYITTRKLQGETLSFSVAKAEAEVSNFSHGGNEEERSVAINAPRVLETAPMEIVREKAADLLMRRPSSS